MSELATIAANVRLGRVTAEATVRAALTAAAGDPFNAFTRLLSDSAIAAAREMDLEMAAGRDPGPLAGVPFAVKDLFDVAGLTTTAGAKMREGAAPATADAPVVARLKSAGAVLIGTLNMDEYAYGFATVNAHFGTTRNPHDTDRLAGGSSGGSAAAVAGGLVPLSLGSDTNGSIRVPASLCGVWGIRPAEDAVPVEGAFPFVHALDTVGPFTRSLADLKLAYEVLARPIYGEGGPRSGGRGLHTPKVARLDGFFARNAAPEAIAAIDAVMTHLGSDAVASLPLAEGARSASFLITAAQGGRLHHHTLKTRALDYDPAVRDRLIAGAMLPAATYLKAWDFRTRWRAQVAEMLDRYDVLIAPATPVPAPRIDEPTIPIDGKPQSARANLGIHAQPISLAGVPVIAAPFKKTGLPIGLQFITAPGREGALFDLLARLEADGVLGYTPPRPNLAERKA